jgi:PEP-CTERM motif
MTQYRVHVSRRALRIMLLSLSLIALLSITVAARADTVFYDDFSHETLNQLDVPGLTNWNILSGSVDVVGGGNLCLGTCLDLDGTNYNKGPLSIETKQTFAVAPGWYELYFDIAGSQRDFRYDIGHENSVLVSVDGLSETVTLATFDPFRTETLLFQANGFFKIRFDSLDSPDYVGLLLNDVGLRTAQGPLEPPPGDPEPPTPVPEPSSVWLLGSVLGYLAVRIKRS